MLVDRQSWIQYNSYEESQHIILLVSSTETGNPHCRILQGFFKLVIFIYYSWLFNYAVHGSDYIDSLNGKESARI